MKRLIIRGHHASSILALAACVSMIASAYAFRPTSPYEWLEEAAGLMLLGVIFMGAALWRNKIPLPLPTADAQNEKIQRKHRVMLLAGIFALALLAAVNGSTTSARVSTHVQFLLLCVGVALMMLGAGAARFSMPHIQWRVVLPLAAIMLLALFLRLWQLNTTIRFLVDELAFTWAILNLRAHPNTEILLPMEGTAAFPFVFAYWQSLGVELLGRNFAGLRVASAVLGTITIPALYWLAKALFDRKTALLAAFLLAVFPPHLHFSRIGLTEIASCLFGTLTFTFLARGLIHNRRIDYVIGGVMLGLAHYFHEGGRILYTPVALVWLVGMMILWRPRGHMRNIFVAGLVALIIAVPVYYTLIARDLPVTARMSTPNVMLDGEYWRNLFASGDFTQHIRFHILEPFLIYMNQPDRTFFYGGRTPLVLDYVVPALLLGTGFVLWRWRTLGGFLLIVWVMATSVGNGFLSQSTTAARYVVVFPALVLLCAVGIRYTLALILPGKTRIQIILMGVLAVFLGVAQVNYYFEQHLPIYNFSSRAALQPHRDGQDAILRSLNFPPGTQVHILSDAPPSGDYTGGLLAFMAEHTVNLDIITMADFTHEYIDNLQTDVDHAFFLDWETGGLEILLRDKFDVPPPLYSPFDIPTSQQYILYYARNREQAAP
jgi:4-amino-4-deoxy-L-arabinose transferase-like glycosyltransferase